MVVASAAPMESDIDYTLLQRRLLPHCNRVYSLLHQNTLENLSKSLELSLINACHWLAMLYSGQNKMAKAEAKYLRALAGFEKAWGPDHTSTLDTVNNLGVLYKNQGKMAEAEAMYLRALAGKEITWGPDHKNTLDTRYNLANLFEEKSMLQDAARHFELVVQGYTKLLGPEHSKTVDASERLKRCEAGSNGVAGNRYSLTVWLEAEAILGDVGALR